VAGRRRERPGSPRSISTSAVPVFGFLFHQIFEREIFGMLASPSAGPFVHVSASGISAKSAVESSVNSKRDGFELQSERRARRRRNFSLETGRDEIPIGGVKNR